MGWGERRRRRVPLQGWGSGAALVLDPSQPAAGLVAGRQICAEAEGCGREKAPQGTER